jgi:hypothetical protein
MLWLFRQFMPKTLFSSKPLTQEISSTQSTKRQSHLDQTILPHSTSSPQKERTTEEWDIKLISHVEVHP